MLCSAEEMTSLLENWIRNLELLAVHLTISSPCPTPSWPTDNEEHRSKVQQQGPKSDSPTSFEDVAKAFQGDAYHRLGDVVKATTTELTTLCAELEVYASKPEQLPGNQDQRGDGETSSLGEIDDGGEMTVSRTELTSDCQPSSTMSLKCGCLVDFVQCYGPLLDGPRLKQMLSSKEWAERKTCLTALELAKPVQQGQTHVHVLLSNEIGMGMTIFMYT